VLDDGATWAGVFGDGKIMKRHCTAVPFADGRTAFVIANGRGYVLDVPSHDLLYRTKIDYWATALSVPWRDFVIAAEFTGITAIGRDRARAASYSSSDGTSTKIGSSGPGSGPIARNELLALAL
jgi:hypothetical protein